MRKIIWLTVIAVAAAGIFLARGPLGLLLFQKVAESRITANGELNFVDGLHVGLCGAGSPLPDPERSAPCTLVLAGDRLFVFDAGVTASQNIARMRFDPGQIEGLFLTHFHSDHIAGIGELMLQRWVGGTNTHPLPIYGNAGVDQIVDGYNQAFRPDQRYRTAHHGEAVAPSRGFGGEARPFELNGEISEVSLFTEPDLEISAFSVNHSPVEGAVGYRIRYKDRTAVISGDTRKEISVQKAAEGADLLVHEALSPQLVSLLQQAAENAGRPALAKIFSDIPDYHTSPEQAAEIARDAGVGALLLTHIVPALPIPGVKKIFLGNADEIFPGPLHIGVDGDFVSLPAGSSEIIFSNRF